MKKLTWLFIFLVIVYLKDGSKLEFPKGTRISMRQTTGHSEGHKKTWLEIWEKKTYKPIAIFPSDNFLYAEVK